MTTSPPECVPELIDGSYYGCGACEPCRDQADREEELSGFGDAP